MTTKELAKQALRGTKEQAAIFTDSYGNKRVAVSGQWALNAYEDKNEFVQDVGRQATDLGYVSLSQFYAVQKHLGRI